MLPIRGIGNAKSRTPIEIVVVVVVAAAIVVACRRTPSINMYGIRFKTLGQALFRFNLTGAANNRVAVCATWKVTFPGLGKRVPVYLTRIYLGGAHGEKAAHSMKHAAEQSTDLPEDRHHRRRFFAHRDFHRLDLVVRNARRSARHHLLRLGAWCDAALLVDHVNQILLLEVGVIFWIILSAAAVTHEPASSNVFSKGV